MNKHSKHIQPSYQIIITVGIVILFQWLYFQAVSIHSGQRPDEAIEEVKLEMLHHSEQMERDIIELVALEQPSMQVRRKKLESLAGEGVHVLPGEQVYIIPNSDILALDEVEASSSHNIFKDPNDFEAPELTEREEMRKRSAFDQWKWLIFHIK